MAKTATINVTDDGDTAVDPLDGIDTPTTEEVNQAFRVTDELRGTAGLTLQFTRVWPNTPGIGGYCGAMGAEEYTLDEATRRFGPGRYVVRLKDSTNKYVKGGGTLNIAANPGRSEAPAASGNNPSDATLQLLEAMNRRQDDQQRASDARREKLWALALAAMPVMPAIIGALKGGGGGDLTAALVAALKPQPQMTPADMVSMLTNLKALNAPDPDASDPIDKLAKLMTLAKDMSGAGEGAGGSNWIDLVRDGLKAAPEMLATIRQVGPQMVPVQVSAVSPQPVPQAAISQPASVDAKQTPAEGADVWVLIQPILREACAKLERWAKEGRNAEIYADVLYDDLPAWLVERLNPTEALAMLNNPQWWEHLTAFHPPLAAYREWLEGMRAELIALVTEQLKDTETEPPANG